MSLRNILTKKKRNANALYSVLNNIDTLEAAYKTASTSQGSAQKEMENFSKSIEFSLGRLSASWQEFQANLLNSQLVKDVVDIGNVAVNVLDKITTGLGGIIPLLTTIGGIIIDAKSGKFGDNFVNDIINGLIKSTTLDTSVISTIMDIPSEYIQKAVKLNELQEELDQFREEYNNLITEEAQEISNVFIEEVHDNIPTLQEMVDEVGMGDLNDYISKSSELSNQEISQTENISETTKALQEKREELLQNISNTEAEIEVLKQDMASEESYNEVINMNTYQKKLNEMASEERATTIANEVLAEKQYSIAEEQATRDIIAENLAEGNNTIAVMENTAARIKQKVEIGLIDGSLTKENAALMQNTARLLENRAAALKAQQASSGFGNVLKNLVTQGLTYAAFWAIGKVISFVGEKIHEATHAVEIAAEKAKEARKQIDDINKSFKETSKTTNDIKQRYAELAQGVQNLGTAFQSQGNLSTDEYEEFLDLSNQLAELYPSLTRGYTENGDAILSLSGSVDTIVNSLDNLIDRSKVMARLEISKQMTDIWTDNMNTISKVQDELYGEIDYDRWNGEGEQIRIDGYKDILHQYEALYKQINSSPSKNVDNLLSETIRQDLFGEFRKIEPELYAKFDKHQEDFGRANFGVLGPEGLEKLRGWLQTQIQEYSNIIQSSEDKIAQINAEMQSQLITYLSGDLAYAKLDKNNQLVVNAILQNFDMSNLPDKDVDSWDKLTQWYHDNIINAISKINSKDIQNNLAKLFSGEGTYAEAQELYKIIYDYLIGQEIFNSDDPLIAYMRLELEGQQQDVLDAATKLTNNVDKERKASYGKFFADFLKEQDDAFVAWVKNDLSIPDNVIYTTQELLDLYDEWLKKTKQITEETKKMRTAADAVDSIAKVESAVSSLSDIYWSTVKKDPNATADDLKYWGTATATQLNSIEDSFNYLIKDEDKDKQEKLTAALKEFEATLVHFPNDSKKAEDAINKLVTSYVNESSVLEDLTEENKEYAIARLKAIGIDNAEEVVQSRLTEQVKATTKAVKALREEFDKYNDVLEQKEAEPEKYAEAIKSLAEKTKQAMAMRDANGNVLKDKNGVEQYFKVSPEFVENHIDTIKKMLTGDQEAFEELQKELEKAEFKTVLKVNLPDEAVEPYFDYLWNLIDKTNLKEIEIGADLDDSAFLVALNAMVGSSWEYAEQIARIFKSYGIDLTIGRQYGKTGANGMSSQAAAYLDKNGPFTGAKKIGEAGLGDPSKLKPEAPKDKSKGGSSADKEKTEYEKAMEVLKQLREADLIDEKQYLDQKRKLIEQLWKDGKMKAEEYFKAIHEWLKEMLSYYNQIISDVTKILNKQKEKIEKERDQRIKAIEEERDAALKAIDEETKALDKKIKAKQKEIDELQEANEARKQAIDLQKAEYELQRSIHQRTLLQYQEGADGKGQLVYRSNPSDVREAQENLEEKKYEKRLSILEKELDVLNEQKDKLSEQREQIEEHYQTLLDETNKYYDEAIKRIGDYIEKWESLAEAEENALMEARLASIGLSIDDILAFDEGSFESFKGMYLGLLNDIYGNNALMQDSLKGTWGDLPGYMERTAQAMKGLNGLDLTSFDNAMASLSNGNDTFKDLDPDSWATDLEGIATKYGTIATEASGAADTAATAAEEASQKTIEATDNATASVDGLKSLLDGSTTGSSGTSTKDTRYKGPTDIPPNSNRASGPSGSLVSAFNDVATASAEAVEGGNGIIPEQQKAQQEIQKTTEEIVGDGGLAEAIEEIKGPHTIEFNLKLSSEIDTNLFNLGKNLNLNPNLSQIITGNGKYEGTVGNAFANGYPGLNSPEWSALRSEYGQPELTVYPDGFWELTTTPTLSDLPKDTVIFNEEQTKRILKNSNANGLKGKSFANGTSYLPLQDVMPDKAELFAKFESNIQDNIEKMKNNIADMTSNVREITHSVTNNMVNNTGNTVNVGDINVTCPGVTEAEVAKNLGAAIRSELNGVVSGMALRANQLAMRR